MNACIFASSYKKLGFYEKKISNLCWTLEMMWNVQKSDLKKIPDVCVYTYVLGCQFKKKKILKT